MAMTEAELEAAWQAAQDRDGFPDEECGIAGHCRQCHGLDGGPACGHYAGCPEC